MDYSGITKLIEPIKSKSTIQYKIGNRNAKVDKGIKSTMYPQLKGIKNNKIPVNNNYNLNNYII